MNQIIEKSSFQNSLEKVIGNHLKYYRLEQNINQTDLSEKAGISRRTITSIENGEGSTLNTLISILRALGRLDLLNTLIEEPEIDPNDTNAQRSRMRKYASKPRKEQPKEVEPRPIWQTQVPAYNNPS